MRTQWLQHLHDPARPPKRGARFLLQARQSRGGINDGGAKGVGEACPQDAKGERGPAMSAADTAWMLMATALVLLMTPALGFFYGGLVRAKNALNTLMMSVIALGFVSMCWAAIGYSIAFAPGNGLMG